MKKLFSRLVLGFLFCIGILTIQKDNIQAEVYLDMENTAITDENVIVSAKLSGDIPYDGITIIVKKNGEEIKSLKTQINTYKDIVYTCDFKKDLGIKLEKNCLYEYSIIQHSPFMNDHYAIGEFYTGDETYVTIYKIAMNNEEEYILRSQCITGVDIGESYHYVAEGSYLQCERYVKFTVKGELPLEYDIENVSEDPTKNIIKDCYFLEELPAGVFKIGGYYIKDSEKAEIVGAKCIYFPYDLQETSNNKYTFVPEDLIEIDGQYYMYDAQTTGTKFCVEGGSHFYENVYDIYYKKCDTPTTQTSAKINFINVDTGEQIQQKVIPDLVVGERFSYVPENAYTDQKYNYVYVAEAAGNVLTLDKLWTNPENNILTVYYKVVSENADLKVADKTTSEEQPQNQTNTIQKEKPVIKKAKPAIKKISRKNKSAIKIKFSKIKKAQGYEICYSTKKSFKKSVTKRVKKTTVTLKNLKKRKTYYVKVRGYKVIEGKTYYSKYSKVKRI